MRSAATAMSKRAFCRGFIARRPVNAIWEGSGNVMCLDVLRALKGKEEAELFVDLLRESGLAAASENPQSAKICNRSMKPTPAAPCSGLRLWQAALRSKTARRL